MSKTVTVLEIAGAAIRAQRGRRSQRDLAAAVDLSESSLSRIESGRQAISVLQFIRIAQALHVSPTTLMGHVERAILVAKRRRVRVVDGPIPSTRSLADELLQTDR